MDSSKISKLAVNILKQNDYGSLFKVANIVFYTEEFSCFSIIIEVM